MRDRVEIDPLYAIAAAARVLLAHDDEGVQLIGEWLLRTGERGHVAQYLGDRCRRETAYSVRNNALGQLGNSFGSDLSISQRAQLVAVALRRYRASAWRRDRHHADCPYQTGDTRAEMWAALKAIDRDLSVRHVRRIISELAMKFDDQTANCEE